MWKPASRAIGGYGSKKMRGALNHPAFSRNQGVSGRFAPPLKKRRKPMSNFRKFAIASFAVLALGTMAQAKGNAGGGGGGPAGNGEPGGVMQITTLPANQARTHNRQPPRGTPPARTRGIGLLHCSSGSDGQSPARCQWN
jgi:hypothetical protein